MSVRVKVLVYGAVVELVVALAVFVWVIAGAERVWLNLGYLFLVLAAVDGLLGYWLARRGRSAQESGEEPLSRD